MTTSTETPPVLATVEPTTTTALTKAQRKTNITTIPIETDLAPILWPALPETTNTYPNSLDEFMDRYGQRLVPSKADRDAARAVGREDLWNFFFQIQPQDVYFIQREEENILLRRRSEYDALFQERAEHLRTRLQLIDERRRNVAELSPDEQQEQQKIAELQAVIKAASLQVRPHGQWIGIAVVVIALLLTIGDALQGPFDFGRTLSTFINRVLVFGVLGGLGFLGINQFRASPQRSELARIQANRNALKRYDYDEPRIKAALATFETEYQHQCSLVDQRLSNMRQAIEPIIAQLPKPPDGQEVINRLRDDLDRYREHYIDRLGLRTRLEGIARFSDDLPINVPNPLPFISPGQLQEQTRIPLPYQPPQSGSVVQQMGVLSQKLLNEEQRRVIINKALEVTSSVSNRVLRTTKQQTNEPLFEAPPLSDRARHLLARQLTSYAGNPHLLHGVYYIEYLFITKSMLVHHGFFYDFILDRTTADRTAEIFFQDIVAIEKNLEYRLIPRRFDHEEAILIEDAPTLSITLPSGDQRSFTFANRAYLDAIKGELSQMNLSTDVSSKTIELDPIQEARLNADEALRFLSGMLRQHKYLPE